MSDQPTSALRSIMLHCDEGKVTVESRSEKDSLKLLEEIAQRGIEKIREKRSMQRYHG